MNIQNLDVQWDFDVSASNMVVPRSKMLKKFPWFLEYFQANMFRGNFLHLYTFLLDNHSIYIYYFHTKICILMIFMIYFNILKYLGKIFKGWCFCQLDILYTFLEVEILSRYVFCPWLCLFWVDILSVYPCHLIQLP